MAFIEQLGVRNLDRGSKGKRRTSKKLQKVRKISNGLRLSDYQIIRKNVPNIQMGTPRKRFTPTKVLPKPQVDVPTVVWGGTRLSGDRAPARDGKGVFFDANDNSASAPVCVLGAASERQLVWAAPAVGGIRETERTFGAT